MEDEPEQISFFHEIKNRCLLPCKPISWPFFFYLGGIVILYGGLGIWLTIYFYSASENHAELIPPAIGTYFMALWATSFFDLTTSKAIANKKAMTISSIVGLGLLFLLLLLSYDSESLPYLWSIVGFIGSLFYWFVVNSDNDNFYESYDERVRNESKRKHGQNWG